MEKVFASVRSPLEISVAVARTSQSPFPLAAIFAQKYFILLENCNKLKRKKYLDYERRRMIRWSNFQRDFAESYTFKAKNRLKFA